MSTLVATAAGTLQTPEQFLGFKVGADNKLVRWDKIVDYMKLAAANSDRVRFRELGKTSDNNPFIALEISSPDTLKNLDRYKQLERKLYFQGGAPTDTERDEIFRQGKLVLLITCSIHATEIGASQMSVELVHHLATSDAPDVKKILDNVIFVLVPSLNPDGQIMVTDWFNKNLGTEYANSPIPYLYHPYVGHDNNRDMYMFTQKESQHTANLLWHDWFPSVWLDEHQMGSNAARIFVMPATDPINANVHPLIYRWNGILGQSQAAALEAAGKEGIIYNSTYTNFWEGAMAWSGWWHNQIGLLTEVASANVAAPIDQTRAVPGRPAPAGGAGRRTRRESLRRRPAPGADRHQLAHRISAALDGRPLDPPRHRRLRNDRDDGAAGDGGGSARDDHAADLRGQPADDRGRQEEQPVGDPGAGRASAGRARSRAPGREAEHGRRRDLPRRRGVRGRRQELRRRHVRDPDDPGVRALRQGHAREADVSRGAALADRRAPEPPYDVTAWSLGMLLGVDTVFVKNALPAVKMTKVDGLPKMAGDVTGTGTRFAFDYKGADSAIAINRLLKDGARVAFDGPSHVAVSGIARTKIEAIAKDFGLNVKASDAPNPQSEPRTSNVVFHAPRVAMYQPWTGGNMDEGWTRWVLEQYQFNLTSIHNADIRAGKLRQKFDTIIIADQDPREIIDGFDAAAIRPEYRGGIGEAGLEHLKQFVADGGTLVTMGNACDLAIEKLPIPVRNLKKGLTRDQHFAPGAILKLEVDTQHPIGYGVAADTYGFYINSPFFQLTEGLQLAARPASSRATRTPT